MSDMQKFDDNIIKNLHMFSFKDDEQVYTNGVELVPLYRVVQILEHFKVQELVDKAIPIKPTLYKPIKTFNGSDIEQPFYIIKCGKCEYWLEPSDNFCSNCGTEIDWSDK